MLLDINEAIDAMNWYKARELINTARLLVANVLRMCCECVANVFLMCCECVARYKARELINTARLLYTEAGVVDIAPNMDLRHLYKKPSATTKELALSGIADRLEQVLLMCC